MSDYRIDNSIWNTGIDVKFYVVFCESWMPSCIHYFESKVNQADLFRTRIDQIESWFQQSWKSTKDFDDSNWITQIVPFEVGRRYPQQQLHPQSPNGAEQSRQISPQQLRQCSLDVGYVCRLWVYFGKNWAGSTIDSTLKCWLKMASWWSSY